MKKSVVLVAFIAVLSFALGGVAFSAHDFSDVPDSHPFHEDISWMADEGITDGFPDGTFRPGQPVTRQAMSAFMRRLAGADPDVGRVVDAALLQGRNAADFDDALTLAGRTSADYDNAVTLNGRTPADYDDAVTLAGRTPADFDNAVTLNGRTPADYDDAVTLNGNTTDDLTTSVGTFGSFGTTTITGTTPGTATNLVNLGVSSERYLVLTMLVNTSYDSGLFTCQVDGEQIVGITDLKIGDLAPGYADRVSVSGQLLINGSVGIDCFYESAVGSGSVSVVEWGTINIENT